MMNKKRWLPILVALMMVFAMMPAGVQASAGNKQAGQNAKKIPVITYHHMCSDKNFRRVKNYKSLYMPVSKFRKQMAYLKKHHWRTVTTEEVALWYDGKLKLPRKSVLITFDDGQYSVLRYAAPILKKNHQKATIFVIGREIKDKTNTKKWKYSSLGWDKIHLIWSRYPNIELQSHTFRMHKRIHGKKPLRVMTKKEIQNDALKMNRILGCTTMAYPWGSFNQKCKRALRDSGVYSIAFTYGRNDFAKRSQSRWALKRIKVDSKFSMKQFKRWFR